MHKLSTCFVLLLVSLLCSAADAAVHVIQVNTLSFSPNATYASPGDTIRWENPSGSWHTVTSGASCSSNGLFHRELGPLVTIFEWVVPIDAPPYVPYFCIPHCSFGMTGMIYVVPPPGFMIVDDTDFVNPTVGQFSVTPGGTANITVEGDSISSSSFAMSTEIVMGDIDVDVVVTTFGGASVSMLDITNGTDIPLTTGTYTLLDVQQYVFHGNAGAKGTFSFSVTWTQDLFGGGEVVGIDISGDAVMSISNGAMYFRTSSSVLSGAVTIEGPGEMLLLPIGGVTSATLTLPASGIEDIVIIPAGSHTIDLAGFATLSLPEAAGGPGMPEDVNGDGVVDVSDLLAIIAVWGATSP